MTAPDDKPETHPLTAEAYDAGVHALMADFIGIMVSVKTAADMFARYDELRKIQVEMLRLYGRKRISWAHIQEEPDAGRS